MNSRIDEVLGLGTAGGLKPSNFMSMQSQQHQASMDQRKVTLLEDKIHQLEDKFSSF